jgi:hypothetical protein
MQSINLRRLFDVGEFRVQSDFFPRVGKNAFSVQFWLYESVVG